MLAMLTPQPWIDMTLRIERRDELISMPRRALRVLLRAGKIEPNALEHMRQLGHGGLLSGNKVLIW
jgi:hypothetical protein